VPIEEKVVYFEKFAEEENTEITLKIAKEYAEKYNIKNIVVASTRGKVAEKALNYFDPSKYNLVIVTHTSWFRENIRQEFDEKIAEKLREKGAHIVTAAHALGGVSRAIEKKYGGLTLVGLIANVLRRFCEGMKVAVEITLMATDAGYFAPGEDVVAIAGTGRGADTAVILTAAPSRNFFDVKIKKILAKPIF